MSPEPGGNPSQARRRSAMARHAALLFARRGPQAGMPRGRGRPTKLTAEVQERLTSAIRAGNFYEAACGYAGID